LLRSPHDFIGEPILTPSSAWVENIIIFSGAEYQE